MDKFLLCHSQFKEDGGSEMKMGMWISFMYISLHFTTLQVIQEEEEDDDEGWISRCRAGLGSFY